MLRGWKRKTIGNVASEYGAEVGGRDTEES